MLRKRLIGCAWILLLAALVVLIREWSTVVNLIHPEDTLSGLLYFYNGFGELLGLWISLGFGLIGLALYLDAMLLHKKVIGAKDDSFARAVICEFIVATLILSTQMFSFTEITVSV